MSIVACHLYIQDETPDSAGVMTLLALGKENGITIHTVLYTDATFSSDFKIIHAFSSAQKAFKHNMFKSLDREIMHLLQS